MSRILALLIFCTYLVTGVLLIGWSAAFDMALLLAVPLSCILWPEFMADIGRANRTLPLPPAIVFSLGWFVFLLPALLAAILWLVL